MYRLFRFLLRTLLYQRHPGKQIIIGLICIPIGLVVCYVATVGVVVGEYVYRWPVLIILGLAVALLGLMTVGQGIFNAVLRGWNGRSPRFAKSVQPAQKQDVPAQPRVATPGKKERERRALQEQERKRRATLAQKREKRAAQTK